MKIAISCETTVDITKELKEKYNIQTVPFSVLLGDKNYLDGEITCDEIIAYVQENKVLPKTGAVNKSQYDEHFSNLLKEHDAIVHISLSSELSSAYSNAVASANELKNVYVIDSRSLSTGIALLAIYARELADLGEEPSEIAKKVQERIKSLQVSFVLERLDYLHKGGRCSSIALLGANLLKIRPRIVVKDGKMSSDKKYRGSMEGVVNKYCQETLQEFNTPDLSKAFITYTTATEGMVENAKKALTDAGFENIYITRAGGTIASHCGGNTLGILYINDGRK